MPSIDFQSVVLCEEVRREANGTAIIIGASVMGPLVSDDDGARIQRLAFYIEAEMVDVEAITFRLYSSDNSDTPLEVEMDFDTLGMDEENSPPKGTKLMAALVFNQENVKFAGAGEYELQYKLKEDWIGIRTFPFPKLMG